MFSVVEGWIFSEEFREPLWESRNRKHQTPNIKHQTKTVDPNRNRNGPTANRNQR
jgi:hypothetical protein